MNLTKDYENSGETRAAAQDMASLTEELNGLKDDFNAPFEIIDVAHISLGEWADPVQEKLEAYFTDVVLKTAQVVKTSTSTAFSFMLGKTASLETQLNTLASKQEAYVKMKGEEPPTKITKYYDKNNVETDSLVEGGYSSKEDNPAWDEWDKNMYAATVVMDGMFDDINADFASLAEVSFDATSPSGAVTGGNTGNKDNQPTEETNTEEAPVFDQNGGADKRHFSSREDAIVAYMAANPGISRTDAEAIIARRLANATIFIPPENVDEVFVAGDQLTEEAAMASGLAEPTEKNVETTDPEHLGDTDDDGTENYRQGQHTDEVYETSDGQTAEKSEDLAISGEIETDQNGGEVLVPEEAEGEAHYTDSDGETYTGEITIKYGDHGTTYERDEDITSDRTGEQVAHIDEDQKAQQQTAEGADVNITSTNITQNGTVTGQRQTTTTIPGQTIEVSSQWTYVQPEEGQPVTVGRYVTTDNDVYETTRGDDGILYETHTYFDNKGNPHSYRPRPVDETVYTLVIKDSQGNVTEEIPFVNSHMGQAFVVQAYADAKVRATGVGNLSSSQYEGSMALFQSRSVTLGHGDDQVTLEIIEPED